MSLGRVRGRVKIACDVTMYVTTRADVSTL
jgi:hypothetical protein